MKKLLPLIVCSLFFSFSSKAQAVSSYTNCPDVNIAIARAGDNSATTNPYFLYNVNQTTGAMTLVPGAGFKDPANTSLNLQVNAVGVNKKDGFIYGLTFDGTLTTGRFVRLDKNYGVTSFGNIPSPSSSLGTIGIVNSAAGETDTSGNYFFTGATINPAVPTLDKFFLGKIANVASLTTGPAAVTYFEIDISSANCSNYVSTFSSDPSNSGLKDFSYNARTNTFFTYVTYKPTGAADFSGQVMEIKPITGSIPLKYQLVCTPVVNHHTAEVAGTLIDKFGKFTILFTDGSFGEANRDLSGVYNGSYTQIAASTAIPNPSRGDMASCGQQTVPPDAHIPFTTCPDVNIGVARAGTNINTQNPYFIYTVNTTTGAFTLLPGGPLPEPTNPSLNLQVNAVGINKTDGFMYGMDVVDSTITSFKFVRFDQAYGVTNLGFIAAPTSPTGVLGIINGAAGDIDRSNNYYFTALTVNPIFVSPFYVLDKLFLGKISGLSTLAGTPTATYSEIDISDANCTGFVSSLSSDISNSGFKDISFSPFTGNSFFAYGTYKPTGAPNYSGQILEIRPITGSSPLKYKLFCTPVINSHTAETAGSLIDKSGNFEVLLTDGTIGKLATSGSPTNYTGVYVPLNNATILPNPLRGDMASCGGPSGGPLPVTLSFFNANARDCKINFSWISENELNLNRYELEQSFDNTSFISVGMINAKNNVGSSSYTFILPAPGRQAYYRLKMTDNDGRISYSSIIPINNACNKYQYGFVINPNPAKDIVNLNWYGISNPTTMNVNIYNAYGALVSKAMQSVPAGSSVINVNVRTLSPGIYFIKATDLKTNESLQERFVKQ